MSRHTSCRCETDPATGLVVRECARCLRAVERIEDERAGLVDDYLGSE